MQIVKQKQTRWIETAPTTTVEEYVMTDKDLSGATAIISGRYPMKGYAVNEKSKEMILVISGNGYIGKRGERIPIVIGDCILLKNKERYYWDGHMALFMVTSPAWHPRQHKIIK